jgi:hypothetical protein
VVSGELPMPSCEKGFTLNSTGKDKGLVAVARGLSMESAELAWRIERARRAVAESETDIRCQRDLIFRIERAREDTTEARALLNVLLERQAVRQQNLSALVRQLSSQSGRRTADRGDC